LVIGTPVFSSLRHFAISSRNLLNTFLEVVVYSANTYFPSSVGIKVSSQAEAWERGIRLKSSD
jgi:hypothetical protein